MAAACTAPAGNLRGGSGVSPAHQNAECALTVRIPGLLQSYTGGAKSVALTLRDVSGEATLDTVLRELDRRYAGLRFRIIDEQQRIRPHIKIFVDAELARELSVSAQRAREVMIVGALSGG